MRISDPRAFLPGAGGTSGGGRHALRRAHPVWRGETSSAARTCSHPLQSCSHIAGMLPDACTVSKQAHSQNLHMDFSVPPGVDMG